jgi:hypothetical protein
VRSEVAVNRRTGALLLLAALFGCGSTDGLPDADALPYRLTLVQDVHQAIAGDLDADGEDELIYWYAPGQMLPGSFMAVVLARHTGEVVEQVNFDGHVRGVLLRDLDGDGRPEILVQLIRNDSLFLSVLGQRGEKLRTFFVTSGRARVEPEGTIPWDPNIVNAFVTDVDGVDGDELVLLVFTGYARLPRGVFVHALPDGRRLGEAIVGAGPIDGILGDFDDDSRPELVVAAIARNNGADAGGFDDSKGHLLLFTLSPTPNVERSLDLPAGFGIARIAYDDFDRDGRAELLAIGGAITGLGGSGEFWMLEPNTWEVLRTRKFDQPLTSPVVLDLDRDTRPEIVALHAGREVRVFDHTFSAIHRRALPGAPDRLTTAPDFDGDGIDELVVHYGMNRSVMLGSDLAPMATWDGGIVVAVVRRGIGNVPLLIVKGPSVDFLARMDANPMYLSRPPSSRHSSARW